MVPEMERGPIPPPSVIIYSIGVFMLVFFDESGDSGMKGKEGSSRLFIVTAILFEENEEAERCDARIDQLRKDLGVGLRFEFHFNKCSDRFREAVLLPAKTGHLI